MKRLGIMLTMGALLLALSASIALAVNRSGGPGDDVLRGTEAVDTLRGNGGNDTLFGFGSPLGGGNVPPLNDALFGNRGNDAIYGGENRDLARGGRGQDLLRGGPGNDSPFEAIGLNGERGNDTVRGMDGNDSLSGGPGIDTIYGGSGSDFVDSARVDADAFPGETEVGRDRVFCGPGRDTVTANTFDLVASDCERVRHLN